MRVILLRRVSFSPSLRLAPRSAGRRPVAPPGEAGGEGETERETVIKNKTCVTIQFQPQVFLLIGNPIPRGSPSLGKESSVLVCKVNTAHT